jgi:hypothetical protein
MRTIHAYATGETAVKLDWTGLNRTTGGNRERHGDNQNEVDFICVFAYREASEANCMSAWVI